MSQTNQLTQQIINHLTTIGVLAWRNNTGAAVYTDPKRSGRARFLRYGARGSGDILAVMPGGIFLSIEVKTGKDKLRDAQREWIRQVERVNGETLIARSLDDVIEFFQRRARDESTQKATVVNLAPAPREVVIRQTGTRRRTAKTPAWVMDDRTHGIVDQPVSVMTYDAKQGKWMQTVSRK